MLFNSLEYLAFLTPLFLCCWFLFHRNNKLQNIFLLISNYVFYGWWDWRFLFLLFFISTFNYYFGLKLGNLGRESFRTRKSILFISISINLILLGFFKYFNFFVESAVNLIGLFGIKTDTYTLNIILPIGISFYTFQAMSYLFDIYADKIKPTDDIVSFFSYLSFFPLILAGPIERAGNLLAQFTKRKEFDYSMASDGLRQILFGLFKKVVIADNCAMLVNSIFKEYDTLPSTVLIMGAIYFAFQIYGDFSGYSDIAIGSAKLLGFQLTTNFRTPYFSRNIVEFWKRWHISLSTWFRDYLFLPIAYSLTRRLPKKYYLGIKNDKIVNILATIITFLVCGLWHGPNWTYVVWGGLIGIYFIPLIILGSKKRITPEVAMGKTFPTIREVLQILTTFIFICITWIFFRAENLGQAALYLVRIFTNDFLPNGYSIFFPKYLLILLAVFLICEWLLFRHDDYLERFRNYPPLLRRSLYIILLGVIFLFIQNESTSFIYFQF